MIRIGLLGASRIAREAVIAQAPKIDDVEIQAVAAREPERARAYAEEHGIAGVEPDYAALVTSDAVDLVYNALPPSEHKQWTIAALEAGKHVLCEKPFAMNAGEARAMIAVARDNGRVLIEAFHHRFHPLFVRTLQILRSKEIGRIRSLAAQFNVPIEYRDGELRYTPSLGGGALMDLGCYPVHWVRTATGEEPEVLSASAEWHDSGVDIALQAELAFPDDVKAHVNCSMDESLPAKLDAELSVAGESGRLVVHNPLAPHSGHELVVETAAGSRSEELTQESTYYFQLQHVAAVIHGHTEPLLDGDDPVANMRVIDAIYTAAGSKR